MARDERLAKRAGTRSGSMGFGPAPRAIALRRHHACGAGHPRSPSGLFCPLPQTSVHTGATASATRTQRNLHPYLSHGDSVEPARS